jgi:Fic family protein
LYYDNLTRIREKNDLIKWCKFFLVGVIETAKNSIMTFDSILKLKEEVESKVQRFGSRSGNAQAILNYLFQRPILDAQKAKDLTGLSLPPVYKLIDEMEDCGIIEEITGAKRGKLYLFREYTKLFK